MSGPDATIPSTIGPAPGVRCDSDHIKCGWPNVLAVVVRIDPADGLGTHPRKLIFAQSERGFAETRRNLFGRGRMGKVRRHQGGNCRHSQGAAGRLGCQQRPQRAPPAAFTASFHAVRGLRGAPRSCTRCTGGGAPGATLGCACWPSMKVPELADCPVLVLMRPA